MITTANTERFTIIHNADTESIVSVREGCTGWLEFDTMTDNGGLERLVVHLQHDGDTCPIHENTSS